MTMDRFDKYHRIEKWAKARYSVNGRWTRCVGNGIAGRPSRDGKSFVVPSLYTVIEDLAAARYLGVRRHFPDFDLSTAYKPEGVASC